MPVIKAGTDRIDALPSSARVSHTLGRDTEDKLVQIPSGSIT